MGGGGSLKMDSGSLVDLKLHAASHDLGGVYMFRAGPPIGNAELINQRGSSGSPVYDAKNRLIGTRTEGVVENGRDSFFGVGFAPVPKIPTNL